MRLPLIVIFFFHLSCVFAQEDHSYQIVKKTVVTWNDTSKMNFLRDTTLISEGWDTLPQAKFWRDVINMSSDSCIINVSYCRKPVNRVNRMIWMNQSEPEKNCYKDSICKINNLDSATNLFVTSGKSEFYEVKKMLPVISKAITAFEKNDCDPWYAQAILLIESPGKDKSKSSVGANGPFQLMRSVAVHYGLHVNKKVDERSNLEKSAKAASSLIKVACIPYVKKFLDEHNISYNETDLWFRLLVLHAYHAGAGNVHCVLDAINPTKGGTDLFIKIWQTTCGGFKNESQNYSQIALASLLNFDEMINQDGDTVYLVSGDKLLHHYNRKEYKPWEAFDYLNQCLSAYEKDFIDDIIPYDYFIKRVNSIRKEFTFIAKSVAKEQRDVVLKKYPSDENHLLMLANELSKRHRYEDAIHLLKLNLDVNTASGLVCDSISRLYMLNGDKKSAQFYSIRGTNSASDSTNKTE